MRQVLGMHEQCLVAEALEAAVACSTRCCFDHRPALCCSIVFVYVCPSSRSRCRELLNQTASCALYQAQYWSMLGC